MLTYNTHVVTLIMTGRQLIKILEENGWYLARTESSHWIYLKEGACRPIPVPMHGNKDIGVLAKRILKEAGIKEERP